MKWGVSKLVNPLDWLAHSSMKCPVCGATFGAQESYCPRCGTAAHTRGRHPLVLEALLAVIALAVLIWLFFCRH
jgi:uncharacterized paraquat-inducible protein A